MRWKRDGVKLTRHLIVKVDRCPEEFRQTNKHQDGRHAAHIFLFVSLACSVFDKPFSSQVEFDSADPSFHHATSRGGGRPAALPTERSGRPVLSLNFCLTCSGCLHRTNLQRVGTCCPLLDQQLLSVTQAGRLKVLAFLYLSCPSIGYWVTLLFSQLSWDGAAFVPQVDHWPRRVQRFCGCRKVLSRRYEP